ncbi:uncharacterized protein [Drosophila takahashii]|uniref:uncharacterized protein n=1 Tax=Drosophila takahashii TaxID=29030 RepID=UPI001CF853DC|nr:uncharacterized protein LOC123002963 [Drosophila takahashii]
MSNTDKNCKINDHQDSELSSSNSNNTSTSSSDFDTSRKHKLRRRSSRNVSFHYQALPMRIVGDNNSVIIADIPCSSRDITLNSAQIIADSSDSEFHISNDTSNDEPANKSITYAARPIEKPDLEFIRKLRKRKHRPNKTLYKD